MHRASGPAYTFIIVGFGLFRKCFHDNFFTKRGGKSSAKSGRAAAGKHPPQPCTGRAGAGKGKGKAPWHLLAQRQRDVYKRQGLAAPQVTYIMQTLKEAGLAVETDATTLTEARDSILAACGHGKEK